MSSVLTAPPTRTSSAPTVRVVTRQEELEELRPAWTALQRHPNADIDFYQMIARGRPEVKSPCVLVLSVNGKTEALLAGRIEETKETFKLGYLPLARLRVRRLAFVYGGNMGRIGPAEAKAFTDAVSQLLRDQKLDFAFFSHLRQGDHLLTAARQNRFFLLRDINREPCLHYRMTIPNSVPELLGRLNRRQKFGREWRALQKSFSGQVNVRRFTRLEEVPEFARDAEAIARLTYHRRMDVGFKNDEEHCHRLEHDASRGQFRGYILYLQQQPKAYMWTTFYKGTVYGASMGYDPDPSLRKYGVGTLLFLKTLEDMCGRGINALDFSFGDAPYKRRFADENWLEESGCLYAPTPRAVMINILRTLTVQTNRLARQALEALRVAGKVKTWWRRQLVRQPGTAATEQAS